MNRSFTPTINLSRIVKHMIRIFIGVVILWVLLLKVGFKDTERSLTSFPVWAGVIFLLAVMIGDIVGGLRLWILNRKCWNCSLLDLIIRYVRVQFIGLIIPAKLGDYLLVSGTGTGKNHGKLAAVITADKILSVICILFLGEWWLLVLFPRQKVVYLLVFVTMFSLVFMRVMLRAKLLRLILRKLLPLKIQALLNGFFREMLSIISFANTPLLSLSCLLFTVRMMLSSGAIMLLINSLGYNLGFMKVFAVLAIDHLVSFIPISVWSLGITESVFLILLAKENIPGNIVLGCTLYCRIIFLASRFVIYFLTSHR